MTEFLRVIEYFDEGGRELVRRVPDRGSANIMLGSQLIVRESQAAVLFRDGKALDAFGAGRHTLTTANLPIFTTLLSLPFNFQSPFRAEVYFVNLREVIDLKWGTMEPVVFRDQDLGMVRLRAFGTFTTRVSNPQQFVNQIVGTQSLMETSQIERYLRGVLVSRLNDLLGEWLKSILDLPAIYDELGAGLRARAADDFAGIGLELRRVFVQAITPPPDVQKAIDERASLGAIGLQNMPAYMQFKAAQAMGDAARNEAGGAAGTGMGLGVGAGLGMMFPQMIAQAGQAGQTTSGSAAKPLLLCANCRAQIAADSRFCPSCGIKIGGTNTCSACQAEIPEGARFCPKCGAKVGG